MDRLLKTGSLKKKENTKQNKSHDNKETDGATMLQDSKTNY
jgi:hypothetical protein